MTDDDARASGIDVIQPASAPIGELRAPVGRKLRSSRHPSVNQLTLQFGRLGAQSPVTSFVSSLVTGVRQPLDGAHRGVRSKRRADSFVGPLMPIHELSHVVVLRLGRRALEVAVVTEREQHRGFCRLTSSNEPPKPCLRHQIEMRGGGDQRAPSEQRVVVDDAIQVRAHRRDAFRRAREQCGIVVDEEATSWLGAVHA